MENIAALFKDEFLFQTLANHWVMTLILVFIVGMFVHFNRKLNATTRHNVWLVTLVSFLLMPLLIFAPRPDIEVPKIDFNIFQTAENISTENTEVIPTTTNAITNPVDETSTSRNTEYTSTATVDFSESESLASSVESIESSSLATVLKVLLLVWLTGVVFLVRRLWLEYRAARELELQSDSVTPYFQRRFEQLCARLGVEEVPPLRFHAGINAPMTVGLYRVWVAIPMMWREQIDDDVFDQTLTHELGHIARKDPLVNTLQRYLEIALWMYPAVWYVSRQLELERESACDDWVLTHDGKGSNYASNLLDVAESLYLQPRVLAVGCLRSHSQLSRRIQNLLDKSSDHAIRNSGKLISGVAAGLFVTLSASAVMWPDANDYLAKLEGASIETSTSEDLDANNFAGEVGSLSTEKYSIDGEEVGIKVNGEEIEFPEGGGTVVINGVEITQTPEPPVPPAVYPVTPKPDVIFNDGKGSNHYTTRTVENDEDGSYKYSIGTNKSKYGKGSLSITRKQGKVVDVSIKPAISKTKQPLLHAVWNDDWSQAKRQIKDGVNVNTIYERPTMPRTVLNAAILQSNLEMVEYLVEKGADLSPHARFMHGDDQVTYPLTVASMIGDKKIVKYLMNKGAQADKATIITAIQSRDTELVDYLFKNDVKMDESALVLAVQNRDPAMVDVLLKNNDCDCLDLDSALIVAVQNRDAGMVKTLMKRGAQADNSALIVAIQNRDKAMAKAMLKAGAEIDDGALVVAIQNRDAEMVDWLLDAGADPDEGSVVIAVQNRDKDLVKRLLKAGADVDDGALVMAIQNRDAEMVDWLLDAGAEPDEGSVVIAVQNRNKDMVKRLLKAGADIDEGALIIAIRNRDKDMVRWLLDAGAHVDDGAMIIAIQSRDNDLIRIVQNEYNKNKHGQNEFDKDDLRKLQAQIEQGSYGLGETIQTIGGVASGVLGIIGDAVELEQYEYQELALLKAMEQENITLARSLMQSGSQPNTLHLLKALELEEIKLAYEMLDRGAKPDSISLLKALEMEDLDLARKCLEKGAKPNGITLLKATEIGDEDFIQELKKHSDYSWKTSSTDFSFDQWPVDKYRVTLGYGEDGYSFTQRKNTHHDGIDLATKEGTKIHAVAHGVVSKVGYSDSYGYYVVIDHKNGYATKYAGNKKNLVNKGQQINQGQIIATVGQTAKNTASPHLHFAVTYQGHSEDPNKYYQGRS